MNTGAGNLVLRCALLVAAGLAAMVAPAQADPDPFAALVAPLIVDHSTVFYGDGTTGSTSSDSGGTWTTPQLKSITSDTILHPGIYWGGVRITGGNVIMVPGRYVMAGGGFSASGSSTTVSGTDVFIYNSNDPFHPTTTGAFAPVSLPASAVLHAPGPLFDAYYQGILVLDDRNPANTTSVSMTGGSPSWQGYIYSVNGQANITTGGAADGLNVVARNISLMNSSTNLGFLQAFNSFNIPNGTSLVINNGRVEVDGLSGVPFSPFGPVTVNSGTVVVSQLNLTNNASSVVNFNGGLLRSSGTTVSNGMAFVVGDGVQSATFDLLGGTHSFANGLLLSSNANLIGSGTIIGSVTNFGGIAPGNSPGLLSITGDLTLMDSSVLTMEVGGPDTNQYDRIDVSGLLVAGGWLNVSFTNGYAPAKGETFDLFGFGAATNSFAGITLPTFQYAGTDWDTSHLLAPASDPLSGSLIFIPEPATPSLLVAGLGVFTAWRRRRAAR
ncbi:MAG: PEP-CTERM sorting domain-containing protein [Verrucomicrobia bacterium]|nr:PEP-CTERM sorting domain-containing protein [Verrucomicrobiota bacterium]